MVLSDGIIYVVGIGKRIGSNSRLYAVDAKTGKEQWKFEASDRLTLSPAVSDGIVYIGCKDNHLYAVDAKTGKEQWKFETGDSISESPTVSDNIVYIFPTSPSPAHRSCKDNHLYAVDAKTGKEQWKFEAGGSINSSPTVLDGIVYIGCKNNLYAVRSK
jgi:outer membrane protein assembly factor BamB